MLQKVDLLTVVGWGMFLFPLLTMWHEIGGHAALCVVQGGRVTTIGAFYVDCAGLTGIPNIVVAIAGVFVNAVLAVIVYRLWCGSRTDQVRLVLWLVWVTEAFVAAGYFCFSGVTGFGDLGTGAGGSLQTLPVPLVIRGAEILIGVYAYISLVRVAIRSLNVMLGTGPDTRTSRRRIAHGYYATAGIGAVLVGLLNPVGVVITIMSAAASSFGGLAGFISIGFAQSREGSAIPFVVNRNWIVLSLGVIVLLSFSVVLGPSRHF